MYGRVRHDMTDCDASAIPWCTETWRKNKGFPREVFFLTKPLILGIGANSNDNSNNRTNSNTHINSNDTCRSCSAECRGLLRAGLVTAASYPIVAITIILILLILPVEVRHYMFVELLLARSTRCNTMSHLTAAGCSDNDANDNADHSNNDGDSNDNDSSDTI